MAAAMIPGFTPRTRSILGPTGIGTSGQVLTSDGAGGTSWASAGVKDHGALTGLSDDDHSIYALLAGRSGGQTIVGGTASGDDLTLNSNPIGDGSITLDAIEVGVSSGQAFIATANAAASRDWMIKSTSTGVTGLRNKADTDWVRFASRSWEEGNGRMAMHPDFGGLAFANNRGFRWSSSTVYYGTPDTGFARDAAGVARTTNGSTGNGDHKMAALRLVPYTTATRPTAGVAGRQIYDSTLGIPVWDNGTQWTDATGAIV